MKSDGPTDTGAGGASGSGAEIQKRDPAPGYPPEEGCYLRGNDLSPVAVIAILLYDREKTPSDLEHLVRVAVENGAALAGTLQTENIGLEKVICNIVANPNIRYLIIIGPESPGHLVRDAIVCLSQNGIDENKRIIGAKGPTPFLFNLKPEFVQRFRDQLTIIDLVDQGEEALRDAVRACYQEDPTPFRDYVLHDPGAWPEAPLDGKLTWRVTDPEREPRSEESRVKMDKAKALMERIKRSVERRKRGV